MNEMNDTQWLTIWRGENRRALINGQPLKAAGRQHEVNRQIWESVRGSLWQRHGRRLFDIPLTCEVGK